MATKSDFTPEEWKTVGLAPVITSMYISLADPSGPIGLVKEMYAAVSSIVEGAKEATSLQLVKDLAADIQSSELKPEVPRFASKEEAQAYATENLTRAVALVSAKSPEDGAAYRQFLYEVAQKAAAAGKEGGFLGFGGTAVSEAETKALADLAGTLGVAA